MDTAKIQELVERYESLPEEEIAELFQRRASLIPEAARALDQVIDSRLINVEAILHQDREESKEIAIERSAASEEGSGRSEFWFKASVIVGLPIITFMAVFRPDSFAAAAIAALMQGIFIAILFLLARLGKKLFRRQ